MTSPAFPSLEDLRAAVERDADRLVEELFSGFEACEQPGVADEAELSAPGSLALRESEGLAVLPEPAAPVPGSWQVRPAATRSWERWFFLGAVLFLLGSLAWFWRQELQLVPTPVSSLPEPSAENVAASRERQEFIAYVQKTLTAIERDKLHTQQLAEAKAERERVERADRERREQEQRKLAELKQRELAEREAAAAPVIPPVALAPPPPKVSVPLVPPPPVIIAKTVEPTSAVAPAKPPTTARSQAESPASPVAPPAVPHTPQPIAARVEPAPPALSLEVLGSLEIGTRALALIEVNGKTERVTTGETVPGTSWSVIKIAPRQVVLRDRGGQERTVPVGSRF